MEFNGKEYPTRTVNHKVAGEVVFAPSTLRDEMDKALAREYYLLKPSDAVKKLAKQAQVIDEQIYSYVDEKVLQTLSDEKFEEYVNRYFD